MNKLPQGWITAPIGALCTLENGRAFKPSEWRDKGIPIVRIQNLNNRTAAFNYFDGEFDNRYFLHGGELLFAWSGTPGTSFGAHIWRDSAAVLNQHIFRVDFDESVLDKRFFRDAINQKLEELIGIAHGGVGLRHVTKGKFENTEIFIPPFNEQKRIADKLDAVLARVDACRERLDRIPAILKRFRQSVLAAATSGKLTEDWRAENPKKLDAKRLADLIRNAHEIAGGHKTGNAAPPTEDVHNLTIDEFPETWELLNLRDLVMPERPITYGILKPGPALDDGIPYVRVADFPNDRLNLNTIRKTSLNIDQEFKRSKLLEGDILLSIRGTVGRLIVIPAALEGANITQDSARLSIQTEINRDYVLWFLRSEIAQMRMKGATKGVAVRGINIGDVRALQVPLPSREEQDEIVRRIEKLFVFADRLEKYYINAHKMIEALTPSLLCKAFRGELIAQDPNDEPACILLERIRTKNVSFPSKSKERKNIRNPKKVQKSEAIMLNSKDIKHNHLTAILKERGPLSAEALWSASQLDIDDFYDQLKDEESRGLLKERRGNSREDPRLLEVA